jgi:hypothetical protein
MAKHSPATSGHRDKAFSELSKAEQRKRASAAFEAAQKRSYAAPKGSEEAKRHARARAAANRVMNRLDGKDVPDTPETHPGNTGGEADKKGPSGAEKVRRKMEKLLPGDPAGALRKIAEGAKAARR